MEIFNQFPFLRYAVILCMVLLVIFVYLLIVSNRSEPKQASNVVRLDEFKRQAVAKATNKGGGAIHQGRLTDTGFDDSSSWADSGK